jgi:hypothetical protein
MADNDKQASATSPAPRKSSGLVTFLWILVILSIGVAIYGYNVKNKVENLPTIKQLLTKVPQLKDLDTMTQSQIEQQGEPINAVDLAADPETVQGRYVVVDGTVQAAESSMADENLAAADFSSDAFSGDKAGSYKGYVLEDGVVLVDISTDTNKKPIPGGTPVRGFGMVVIVNISDIWDLPFVGKDLKNQFGNIKNSAKQVVFVFSQGVKEIKMEEMTPPKGAPMSDGWPGRRTGDNPSSDASGDDPAHDASGRRDASGHASWNDSACHASRRDASEHPARWRRHTAVHSAEHASGRWRRDAPRGSAGRAPVGRRQVGRAALTA